MPSLRLLSPPARLTSPPAWSHCPAAQQPPWPDLTELDAIADYLRELPGLTTPGDVAALGERLAQVQGGEAFLLQGGDCAEPLGLNAIEGAVHKRRLLADMAHRLTEGLGVPVVSIGRLAGQFAKPRSEATEVVNGERLPAFRGLMVNDPVPEAGARQPDPYRLLSCYYTAKRVLAALEGDLWASHEALILHYEHALTRFDPLTGKDYLLSTHLPWIGDRTRQPDGAHVAFLASVANPVEVKLGPSADPATVVQLCRTLDPQRTPGRLTLVSRMGAGLVHKHLAPIVSAVRDQGHPVTWICDPMHGNTLKTGSGRKTRYVAAIHDELASFFAVMAELRQQAGGVHLELTAEEVTECVGGVSVPTEADLEGNFTSLCDPRLNEEQALFTAEIIAKFADRMEK